MAKPKWDYDKLLWEYEQLQAVNIALQTEVAQGRQYFSEVAKAREALRLARDSFVGTHEENKRLNAFMKCVIEDLEVHLLGIDDEIEQRNINRFIIDIRQNLSKP